MQFLGACCVRRSSFAVFLVDRNKNAILAFHDAGRQEILPE